jgi:hypothetical protein
VLCVLKELRIKILKKLRTILKITNLEENHMARSKSYKSLFVKSLKKPKEALAYLNAVLEDYNDNDEESKKLLLMALKDIATAQGGIVCKNRFRTRKPL